MSKANTDLIRRGKFTREWLDSSFSQDAAMIDEQQSCYGDEQGLASQLYHSCQCVLRDLCVERQVTRFEGLQRLLLREELAKLYLWGQSFGPGELDVALDHSDDARYITLDALGCIGQSLLHGET